MSSPTDPKARPDFTTGICLEQPAANNPYVAERRYLAGYDIAELWRNCTYPDVLLLLLLGELPTQPQRRLLDVLLIGLINPGPRHPAVRAAMLAGVSKTSPEQLLPIGLLAGSGLQGGALEVESAHEFIQSNIQRDAVEFARQSLANNRATPGFGSRFGAIDPIWQVLGTDLFEVMPDHPVLTWCHAFVHELQRHNRGWLLPGIAAASGLALGLGARETLGLFQLAIAPGVMAHGMEQTHKPISSNALLKDDQYELQDDPYELQDGQYGLRRTT